MMALESHEIDYSYPPLAKATWDQTFEVHNDEVKATFTASRHTHTGVKRSRDDLSEEEDESYAPPSSERIPIRMTRSKT